MPARDEGRPEDLLADLSVDQVVESVYPWEEAAEGLAVASAFPTTR